MKTLAFGACALVLLASNARADAGDVHLGAAVTYASSQEGRAGASVAYGLSDWLEVRVHLAGAYDVEHERARLLADAALVYAFDVLTWVPEVSLGAGLGTDGARAAPRFAALLALRRYLGHETYVSLGGGAERDDEVWRGLVSVAVWL